MPIISSINTLFTYFSPSRSPYYIVFGVGVFALIYAYKISNEDIWSSIFTIFLITLSGTLILVLSSKIDNEKLADIEYFNQLKFARSIGIAIALISLVIVGEKLDDDKDTFQILLIYSLIQIAIFFTYSILSTLFDKCEIQSGFNFLQLSHITIVLFVGLSISIYLSQKSSVDSERIVNGTNLLRTLWTICMIRWLIHIISLIKRVQLMTHQQKIDEKFNRP